MTSQKTVERCRKERDDLKTANAQLLENNTVLAASNKELRDRVRMLTQKTGDLELAKEQCTAKCKAIVSEKDRELREKQQYIANLHDTIWHLRNSFACKTYNISETPNGFKLELVFGRK